ncbi:hypothetical protein [Enterobacter roggenkampii]|uniref:hypothetical protein n=1 Tax=Enterobacter roggenkampii TaxID=1812935 RepID=UPI002DB632C3|nr:hypothetical protein [Enterobacter roggenkampii]MEB6183585.1 hypothetical protein [Enterobacter roggenkampii]
MSQYTFVGVIHPTRAIIDNHKFKVKASFHDADNKIGFFNIDVRILMNQLLVNVEGDDIFDAFTMRNLIQGVIEVDLAKVAVITGHYYRVEVIRVINNTLEWDVVYGIDNTLIQNYYPIENYDEALKRIRRHSIGELGYYIGNALLNMSKAIGNISDASFYCNRALECLRNHNSLRLGKTKEKDWNSFKLALGLEDDFIKENVGKYQLNTRHGHPDILSEQQYSGCLKATWGIFYRYLDILDLE